jgi:hypothetical protein
LDRGGDLDGRVEINVAFGSAGGNDTASWLWRPDTVFAQPVEVEFDSGLDPSKGRVECLAGGNATG